jgi:uncharacterized protein YhjY with autotransporter beta-barrel domain
VGVAVNDAWVVGVAASGATTTTTLSPMRVTAKPVGGFVYGIFRHGGWRLAASAGLGHLHQSSRRDLIGLGTTAQSSSGGRYYGAALRAEWGAMLGPVKLSPYAGIDYMASRYQGAQEYGLSLLTLRYGVMDQHLVHYQAGLKLAGRWMGAHGHWQPWLSVGGEGWGGDRTPRLTETLGSYTQTVNGSGLPHGAMSAGAGVSWSGTHWDAGLAWHGAWGSHYHGNSGSLQVRYRW